MPKVIVEKSKFLIKHFRGKAIGIVRPRGGGGGAEGGVAVMNSTSLNIHEVGDVFVAVVEVVGGRGVGGKENQRARGDGFRWVPDIGVEEGVIGATELLDAEVVVVDEALEKVGISRLGAHFNAAAHAVEGHGDHGVAGLPTDRTVLCVVDNRPNARLGLDEDLISIRIVLGREVIDGGVLVEIIGGVGLAFGGGAVSDIIVVIGNLVCRNQFVADVVTVTLIVFGGTAIEEIMMWRKIII